MEPSEIILQGRRYCESISGYTLLEDLKWLPQDNKWVIKYSITGEYAPTPFVPVETVWYAFLSADYPFGTLSILPATDGGIDATFPHMTYNIDTGKPWRTGDICVKTNYGTWKSIYFNHEPFDVSRLQWSVIRSKAWIQAAASETLQVQGDPFEFPQFPVDSKFIWAFHETPEQFQVWRASNENNGVLHFFTPHFNKNVAVVSSYFGSSGQILTYNWGLGLTEPQSQTQTALWYRFSEIPVLPPWKIPMNWGELFKWCASNGWDLKSFLQKMLVTKQKYLHKTKVLAIGFPVSPNVGQASERLHWFAIQLPDLLRKVKGFSSNGPEWRRAQFLRMFAEHKLIKWLNAANWAKDQITTRGVLDDALGSMNICVVGLGAVGSHLVELLARLGCEKFTLVDNDCVSIGNLSRHTLTMESLTQYKTVTAASRLNTIFPHISVVSKADKLEKIVNEIPDFLEQFQLVVDCTAEDGVLRTLESNCNYEEQIIFSVSLGQEAQSLLLFMMRYPHVGLLAEFKTKSREWSEKQKRLFPNPNFPLEGIGCWHPIFPARVDDIQGLAAPVIRQIEIFLGSHEHLKMIVIDREGNGNISISNVK